MRRVRFADLLLVNSYWPGLSFMWNSLHVIVIPALLLLYVDDARKNTVLGLLTFFGLIIAMIVQPVAGAVSDAWVSRHGRRRPLIVFGTLLDLVFLALIGTAQNLATLAVGYIGLQFASNLAHGPAQGLMHDRVPPERMGLASGVKNFLDMLGLVVSSLTVGRLLSPDDPRPLGVVALIAGLLVLGAATTALGVREDPAAAPSGPAGLGARLRAALRVDVRRNTAYARLIAVRLFFLIGVYGIQTFAQYYVRDTLPSENPVQLTGDLLAAIALALIAFSVLGGALCDRFGRKPLHVAAALLMAGGSALMLAAHTPGTVLLFGSVVGAGIGLFITANWALANDLAPPSEAGKFLGLTNLATAGAAALSRLAGPGIDALNAWRPGEHLGYAGLFFGASLVALLSLLLLRGLPDRVRQGSPAPAA